MLKGYVIAWRQRDVPQATYSMIDMSFDHRPEKGHRWKTQSHAEQDCTLFNALGIRIPTMQGESHMCTGFTVEENVAGEFVVFCEAPFTLKPDVTTSNETPSS
jgi:hypothetical protein